VYVVCCNIATIALLSTIAPNASFIEALKNSPARYPPSFTVHVVWYPYPPQWCLCISSVLHHSLSSLIVLLGLPLDCTP
jgi:hypothetical protein